MKFVEGDSSTTAVNILMWYYYVTVKVREGDNIMMPIINIVNWYMIFNHEVSLYNSVKTDKNIRR